METMILAFEIEKRLRTISLATKGMRDARATTTLVDGIDEAVGQIRGLLEPHKPQPGRFVVHEQFNGFRVEDTVTGEDHWLSDGVDCVPDPEDEEGVKYMPPGGELFCALWAEQFNCNESETLEAYWPEQWRKEGDA